MTANDGATVLEKGFAALNATYAMDDWDPHDFYRECRAKEPVTDGDLLARFGLPSQADFTLTGRPIKTVYRHADVLRVLRDQETFSARLMLEGFATFFEGVMMTGLDGAEHRKLRALVQPGFSPVLLKRWTGAIDQSLRRNYLEPLLPEGGADLVTAFAVPFPVRVVYEILGFPDDQAAAAQFAAWTLTILSGFNPDPAKAEKAMAAAFAASDALFEHVLPIVARRRADGALGEDMIAMLLRAEEDGERLTDRQITNIVRMMLGAATETTTRAFGNLMVQLLRRPKLLERIRNNRALISRTVTESLRYDTVAGFVARIATIDTEIADVPIPAGTALSLCLGSANRDETIFVDGDTFDIDRPLKPNAAFGLGVHTCLGMPVARIELEGALNAVLDMMPQIRLDPDQPPPVIRGIQMRGPDAVHVRWD